MTVRSRSRPGTRSLPPATRPGAASSAGRPDRSRWLRANGRPDHEHEREHCTQAGEVPERAERSPQSHHDEAERPIPIVSGCCAPSCRTLPAVTGREPPRPVDGRQRHHVQQRAYCQPRRNNTASPTTNTIVIAMPDIIERDEPREQTEPVAAIERPVVVGEQQVHEPEHDRTRERHLERLDRVLPRRRRTA